VLCLNAVVYTVSVSITMSIRIVLCRSVTTSIQRRDCHTFMTTTFRRMKLTIYSVDRYKIYVDVRILALRSVRLERDDI
jgi:hypothetical protein